MKIRDDEREFLAAELAAVAEQLPPEARRGYDELLAEVSAGEVGEASVGVLERFLEVGLETGRIRKRHGAHAEMAAVRLFQRTPRGAALRDAVAATNEALEALRGARIEELAFSLRGPGALTLTLETDRCRATLQLDRDGPRVQSLEVNG
jgi:hypothetical protein